MIQEKKTEAVDGTIIPVSPDTVCLHGDSPQAVQFARRLREVLTQEGITIKRVESLK